MPSLFKMTQDGMPKNSNNSKQNVAGNTLDTSAASSNDAQKAQRTQLALQKIEKLQLELQNNPRSLAFPQLADLYVNEEMFDEAYELLERGLKYHPNSVSAMIILAKILKHREHYTEAEKQLTKAITLAAQNWQAYLLRADLYVKTKSHKKALEDFKKVLIFNPTHPIARRAVAKLEMLTVDSDIDADGTFEVAPLRKVSESADKNEIRSQIQQISQKENPLPFEPISPKLERILSLIDAFTMRQDYAKALKLLYECKSEFGNHSEISQRLLKLSQFESAEKIRPKHEIKSSRSRHLIVLEKKQKTLELLLRRIKDLRNEQLVRS